MLLGEDYVPIAPGQVVNTRYQIIHRLGQGGFGAVYLAHDLNLDRPCALKENLETSTEVMRQFMREAQLLANLSHPNLPRVIDYFVLPDQGQYLVMDYVEGQDLQEILDQNGQPLQETQAVHWISQVCDALTYLHRHDPPIIHRDIKPGNIRITPRGQAMLVDFGIAKFYDRQALTTVGARAFTPGYSPPEQYGKGATDERSDIYALGATLYTLLTNLTPADSVDMLAGNTPPIPPVHVLNPQISRKVGVAITQAMEPERTRRFRTVEEFKSALYTSPSSTGKKEGFAQNLISKRLAKPTLVIPQRINPSRRFSSSSKQKPRRPNHSIRVYITVALAILILGLLTILGAIWLSQVSSKAAKTQGVGQATSQPGGAGIGLELTAEPTFITTDVPIPSEASVIPPEAGALLIDFPQAKIAFASDHAGDGKDRIYIYNLQAGKYWLTPVNDFQYQLSKSNPTSPVSDPEAVPMDENQERSWWPEWCNGNKTLLFESGDKQTDASQTIYSVTYEFGQAAKPVKITWSGYPMLGVPRCANRNPGATTSARLSLESESWQLQFFDVNRPNDHSPVGDGFLPFGGYVTYSGDDSWMALMHKDKESDSVYRILQFQWNNPQKTIEMPLDPRVYTAMYPSISPATGQIAYACELEPETRREPGSWGLCLQDANGQDFRILESVGFTTGLREGFNRFHVFTPRWSADGRWIAYASPKDGDWDIYLYSLEQGIEFNLTQSLTGDQFQPSWSKP
jgi:serine/threonine protein kinase